MNKKKVSAIIISSIVAVNTTAGVQAYATTNKNVKQVEAKSTTTPTINGIKVKKALIDINYSKGVIIKPKYIVIHDTDNRNKGANAMANRNYFANHPNANASAHYLVDDSNIVQALEDNWRGWHVGDGNHPIYNNSNTIGIELCVNSDNDFDKTVEHGIELTKYLMKKHNIPAENVIRHNDVSGKICPKMMIQDRPELWGYFKRAIGATAAEESVLGKPKSTGTVVNVSSTLNVRSSASTGSSVVSTLRKGESVNIYGEENGFYKIGYLAGSTYKYGYASKDYIKANSSNNSNNNNNNNNSGSSSGDKKIGKVVDISTTLNVRSAPSTSSDVIGQLKLNDEVEILYTENGWHNIKLSNGKTGYVSSKYIEVKSSSSNNNNNNSSNNGSSSNENKKIGKVVNISTTLNVRSAPSTNSDVIGQLKLNEEVEIIYTSNGWHNIKLSNGKTGYVSGTYIEIKSSSTNKPAEKPDDNNNNNSDNGQTVKYGKVVNVSSTLNVRKSASTSSEIIGQLKPNEQVKILGTSNGWYKIGIDGKIGYVSTKYIDIIKDSSNGTEVTKKIGIVTDISTSLNVRTSPSTSATVLGYLLNNEQVEILSTSNGWHKISFKNNKIGYVSTKYITVKEVKEQKVVSNFVSKGTKGKVINAPINVSITEKPSAKSKVVSYLLNDSDVTIEEEEDDWYKVQFKITTGTKEGYVKKENIELL